ncbi:MAG: hypothetical protein LBJ67_04975 [Planctomycetaceae bacterium]|nr:hypothetical protein [Planctomycetaceae bacterium]
MLNNVVVPLRGWFPLRFVAAESYNHTTIGGKYYLPRALLLILLDSNLLGE